MGCKFPLCLHQHANLFRGWAGFSPIAVPSALLSGVHLVRIFQRQDSLSPETVEFFRISGGPADHFQQQFSLGRGGAPLAVKLQREPGKVADHKIEDLIDHILAHFINRGILQDQLAVDHQDEDLAKGQHEVGVLLLPGVRGGAEQCFLEESDLFPENMDVGQIVAAVGRGVVMEEDLAQAPGRPLIK